MPQIPQQEKSLFFLNYGRHPVTPLALFHPKDPVDGDKRITRLQQTLWDVYFRLQKKNLQMKKYLDDNRQDHDITIGNYVWLQQKHIQMQDTQRKLQDIYIGPFKISAQYGLDTFELEGLPATIPCIQNVRFLRPYIAPDELQKEVMEVEEA